MNNVTFQINLAPGDFRHSKTLLEHQISAFNEQVDEILLTYDFRPKKVLSKDELSEFHEPFMDLIEVLSKKYPKIRFHKVDYSEFVVNDINRLFYNGKWFLHNFRGAPLYAYLYGFASCKNDYILHIDSDMFFGGLSNTWINEAIKKYESDKEILYLAPHPGPPHPDNILKKQQNYTALANEKHAFEIFDSVSTRILFVDRRRLYGKLTRKFPPPIKMLYALVRGFSFSDRLEKILFLSMKKEKLKRVDFLGKPPGLYSVHPNYRSAEFYEQIPEMIERLKENKNIPESQLGFYDFSEDFIDWGGSSKLS